MNRYHAGGSEWSHTRSWADVRCSSSESNLVLRYGLRRMRCPAGEHSGAERTVSYALLHRSMWIEAAKHLLSEDWKGVKNGWQRRWQQEVPARKKQCIMENGSSLAIKAELLQSDSAADRVWHVSVSAVQKPAFHQQKHALQGLSSLTQSTLWTDVYFLLTNTSSYACQDGLQQSSNDLGGVMQWNAQRQQSSKIPDSSKWKFTQTQQQWTKKQ